MTDHPYTVGLLEQFRTRTVETLCRRVAQLRGDEDVLQEVLALLATTPAYLDAHVRESAGAVPPEFVDLLANAFVESVLQARQWKVDSFKAAMVLSCPGAVRRLAEGIEETVLEGGDDHWTEFCIRQSELHAQIEGTSEEQVRAAGARVWSAFLPTLAAHGRAAQRPTPEAESRPILLIDEGEHPTEAFLTVRLRVRPDAAPDLIAAEAALRVAGLDVQSITSTDSPPEPREQRPDLTYILCDGGFAAPRDDDLEGCPLLPHARGADTRPPHADGVAPGAYAPRPTRDMDRAIAAGKLATRHAYDIACRALRPDGPRAERLLITVDGGCGSGKRHVVLAVARALTRVRRKGLDCSASSEASCADVKCAVFGSRGAGKSTLVQSFAARFSRERLLCFPDPTDSIYVLPSGMSYRVIAAKAIDHRLVSGPRADFRAARLRAQLEQLALRTDIRFMCDAPGEATVEVDGSPHCDAPAEFWDYRVHEQDVDAVVSNVASIPGVRAALVQKHRAMAAEHRCVIAEGVDVGSVVFPEAAVKFYLHATPQRRAKRRIERMRAYGCVMSDEDSARLELQLMERDQLEAHPTEGARRQPEGFEPIDIMRLDDHEAAALVLWTLGSRGLISPACLPWALANVDHEDDFSTARTMVTKFRELSLVGAPMVDWALPRIESLCRRAWPTQGQQVKPPSIAGAEMCAHLRLPPPEGT